jgi:hypothetical protein
LAFVLLIAGARIEQECCMAKPLLPPDAVCPKPKAEGAAADGSGPVPEPRETTAQTIEVREDTVVKPWPPPRGLTAVRIAVWGGVGGGVGRVLWESTFENRGLVDWGPAEWVGFFLAVGAVVFWETRIKPPLKSRLSGGCSSAHPLPSHGVGDTLVAALQAMAFVLIVAMILQLVLGPLRRNPSAFLRSVLTITVICGGITCAWALCAQRSVLWRMLSGFLSGFAVSYLAMLLDLSFWPGDYKIPGNQVFDTLVSWKLHRQVGLNALAWGSYGLMGSLAISRKWGPCPSMSVLAGTLALDPIWIIIPWAWLGKAYMERVTVALLLLGTFRTMGWAIGLYICPVADAFLDPSRVNRSRRGAATFWGMALGAVLLYGVVIAAIIGVSHPAR